MVTNFNTSSGNYHENSNHASTVADAFDRIIETLKLDAAELAEARQLHNRLTQQLKEVGIIDDAFLQGSLARATSLAPLRDIDKVAVMNWSPRDTGPGSAARASTTIANALSTLQPSCKVEIGKHAVKLDRGPDTFSFDIVPAIDLNNPNGDVLIVDTDQDRWEVSNTRELIRLIQKRNADCVGRFVVVVRLAKLFVRESLNGAIPGLHVERFAFDVVTRSMPFDSALAATLERGAQLLLPGTVYSDPTGFDEISRRLDAAERERGAAAFRLAAIEANQAVHLAGRGEHNAAIAIWHRILGNNFAGPSETKALEDLAKKSVGVTSVVTATAPIKPPVTRSWGHGRS